MTVANWPLFELTIHTPMLELRLVRDEEMDQLIERAREIDGAPGVFLGPWSALPDPDFGRGIAQFQWRCRAEWTADSWNFPLGVFRDGELVGLQDMGATNFGQLREVSTGSWVSTPFAGQGIGTEMRAGILHLAFDGLGAEIARSSARDGNKGSLGVSRKLGYVENGVSRIVFGDGEVARDIGLELTAEAWAKTRPEGLSITGLESCLDLFIAAERVPETRN